jgi:hypothetical protein
LEIQLSTPAGAADTALYEKHGTLQKQLDDAMEAWEPLPRPWNRWKRNIMNEILLKTPITENNFEYEIKTSFTFNDHADNRSLCW